MAKRKKARRIAKRIDARLNNKARRQASKRGTHKPTARPSAPEPAIYFGVRQGTGAADEVSVRVSRGSGSRALDRAAGSNAAISRFAPHVAYTSGGSGMTAALPVSRADSDRLRPPPLDDFFTVGHPVKPLSDMRRALARSAQIGGPDCITQSFQVSTYSGEPVTSIF